MGKKDIYIALLLQIICQQNCYKLPILCVTEAAGIKLPYQLMRVWFPPGTLLFGKTSARKTNMECTFIQFTGCLHGSSEIPCKHLCFQLVSNIYICSSTYIIPIHQFRLKTTSTNRRIPTVHDLNQGFHSSIEARSRGPAFVLLEGHLHAGPCVLVQCRSEHPKMKGTNRYDPF